MPNVSQAILRLFIWNCPIQKIIVDAPTMNRNAFMLFLFNVLIEIGWEGKARISLGERHYCNSEASVSGRALGLENRYSPRLLALSPCMNGESFFLFHSICCRYLLSVMERLRELKLVYAPTFFLLRLRSATFPSQPTSADEIRR